MVDSLIGFGDNVIHELIGPLQDALESGPVFLRQRGKYSTCLRHKAIEDIGGELHFVKPVLFRSLQVSFLILLLFDLQKETRVVDHVFPDFAGGLLVGSKEDFEFSGA